MKIPHNMKLSDNMRMLHMIDMNQRGGLVNKAKHKTMPQLKELLKTMRLLQKIRLRKMMWQDGAALNNNNVSQIVADSFKSEGCWRAGHSPDDE